MSGPRKRPAILFYTGDWLKDPALSMCSPPSRGIWMDLLCLMHENKESGEISGPMIGLARACRCTYEELEAALAELVAVGVCPEIVRGKNGGLTENVTVVNRRMSRDAEIRKSDRDRKKRERERRVDSRSRKSPEEVTPPLSVTSSFSPSVTSSEPPSTEEGSPSILDGLELFQDDEDLRDRWDLLWNRWTESFPGLNLKTEIFKAHEFELQRTKSKRAKSKARYLTNWFSNAVKFQKRDAVIEGRPPGKAGDDWLYGGAEGSGDG